MLSTLLLVLDLWSIFDPFVVVNIFSVTSKRETPRLQSSDRMLYSSPSIRSGWKRIQQRDNNMKSWWVARYSWLIKYPSNPGLARFGKLDNQMCLKVCAIQCMWKLGASWLQAKKNNKPYRHVRMSANVSGSNGIDQLNEKKRTAYYLLIK